MDKITFLCGYHNLLIQIEKKKEYIDFCDERSFEIPGPSYGEKIGSNPNRNLEAPFVKWIERRMDAEMQLKDLQAKVDVTKSRIEDAISAIGDPELQMILIYHYIDWMSWSEIAKKMYFSKATVRRKHDAAIELLNIKKDEHT